MSRLARLSLLTLALAWATTAPAAGQTAPAGGAPTPFIAPGAGGVAPVADRTDRARKALRDRFGRQALLDEDEGTGGVRVLGRLDGLLTGPDGRSDRTIAREFLLAQRTALGLDAADLDGLEATRSASGAGLAQVDWVQTYRGLQNIDSLVRVNLTEAGQVVNVQATARHDMSVPSITPEVSAAEAYAAAGTALGDATPRLADGRAKLVLYDGATAARLGWRLLVPVDSTHVYDVVVDARNGEVQRASNYVRHLSADVIRNAPGAAVGGTSETVNMDAYLNPGATTLDGPHAKTVADPLDRVTDPSTATFGTDVAASAGNFRFPLTFTGSCAAPCIWSPGVPSSWQGNRARDAAQIQWFVSNFHDHLANTPAIDFSPANRSFTGSDKLIAQSMDGSAIADGLPDAGHINNANMTTYPDGTSPMMQLYLTDVRGGQSTGMDASVVYHEYSHGLVGRSIVDGSGIDAADGPQGGAINEGTADWFATDYLHSAGSGALEVDDAAIGDVTLGEYTFGGSAGLGGSRAQPMDCTVGASAASCPAAGTAGAGGFTFGDFGKIFGVPEVHADGEIIGQTMWSLRRALIAQHGQAVGEAHVRRLYASGLRLTPPHPGFLDFRNAVLQADAAAGLGDGATIWQVFAERGMGYFAFWDEDTALPVEDFSLPPAGAAGTGTVTGLVTDVGTGTGQSGIRVAFAGHDSGVGPELSATTDGTGRYTIGSVPAGTYPELRAFGESRGYAGARVRSVAVGSGATVTRDFALRRNLASQPSGAAVQSFTGQRYTGCNGDKALDGRRDTGWLTDQPGFRGGEKQLTVRLAEATTVGEITIDPTPGCSGVSREAGLGAYEVQVSNDDVSYTTVARGTFTFADLGRANRITPSSTPPGTRFVRVIAKGPIAEKVSGLMYMAISELGVFAADGAPRAPTATTAAADAVGVTGAALHGSVNPNGTATEYRFEFGRSVAYGGVAPAAPVGVGSGTGAVAADQVLTGLEPSTTYHFRLTALRGGVLVAAGADRTFTTSAASAPLPVVATLEADDVRQSAATLNGTIDPQGTATSYRFELGTTTAYGTTAPAAAESVGSEPGEQSVNAFVSGLVPGTTYHFRITALRGGTVVASGTDRTFTTAAGDPAPVITTEPATGVTSGAAQLNGTINPSGAATTTYFEYGLTTAYGQETNDVAAGTGTTTGPTSAPVSGLQPKTTYHFRAVALRGATKYVGADRTFTTLPLDPVVTTDAASSVTASGARLNATINPRGGETFYHFEYGTTTAYGQQTQGAFAGAGPSPVAVFQSLTGLAPGVTYHFRVVGLRGSTRFEGADRTFTTVNTNPIVTTVEANNLSASSAVLNGRINPRGIPTTYRFEYGTTTAYGRVTPETSAGSGSTDAFVSSPLSGLAPATTYHFRLVGLRGGTRTEGADLTFTTTPGPAVATTPATALTQSTARLNGTVNPMGVETTYRFELGTTTNYGIGGPAPAASVGNGSAPVAVSLDVEDLQPATTYHFRLVGLRGGAPVAASEDRTFTTQPLPEPVPVTGEAAAVTATSATLTGSVDAKGTSTAYQFEYGRSTAYGSATVLLSAGRDSGPRAVAEAVSGLEPGSTYHFRVVAVRGATRFVGADRVFTTQQSTPDPDPNPNPDPSPNPNPNPTPDPTPPPTGPPTPPVVTTPPVPPTGGPTTPTARVLRGAAGKIALNCRLVDRQVACVVTVKGASGRNVSVTVKQGARTVASGTAKKASGGKVALAGSQGLAAGKATVVAKVRKGRRTTTVRATVTLR